MKCKNCEHHNICTVCNYIHDKCGYYEPTRPHGEWIPITYRPMDDEEYEELRSEFGEIEIPVENRKMFSCKMPNDGQEILVCTKCGHVYIDIFEIYEYVYGLESNGDWDGITAWMPLPEPYKKEGNDNGRKSDS